MVWMGRLPLAALLLAALVLADLATRETVFATYGPGQSLRPLADGFCRRAVQARQGLPRQQRSASGHRARRGRSCYQLLAVLRAYWPDWLKDERIRIFLYQGCVRHPDLPDVAASIELAKTQSDRNVIGFFINNSTIGRALVAPPDLSPDVLGMLRTASWLIAAGAVST
jgi:hypothetical protein